MTTPYSIPTLTKQLSSIPVAGCLASDSVQAQAGLTGETLQCVSGHLWMTVENEGVDHILFP
ncbi:MAG TPA: hypothetical protein VN436_00430, partial [Holophaga sp.]|nr:hypothetical protein [Holophaga sp.]